LLVNIKGMFYVENRTGGWGFVVRDQTSTARESGPRALPQVSSAAMSEIIACCQGCSGMGYTTRVTIESDSLNLVHAMKYKGFDRAHEGIIYRDLRLYMQLSFNSFEFSFVPRECNKLAHDLAALGGTWQDTISLCPESLPVD
jgi:ribonuclease HI